MFYVSSRSRIHGITFNKRTWTKKVEERFEILNREAAREWLRQLLLCVPVWRGFARGSVKFARGNMGTILADYLRVAISIDVRQKEPKNYFHTDGRKIPKEPERAGVFGKYSFTTSNHVYRFTFSDKVAYFFLNNFYEMKGRPSTPWHFYEKASEAYRSYILSQDLTTKLPNVKDFIVTTELIKKEL